MKENTSPMQLSGRKASIEARSPLPTPLFLSLCRYVVRLTQTYVYALIKELTIRRARHGSEIHSNKSRHLAKGVEVARLQRRLSLV